jgi:hypothetical protein
MLNSRATKGILEYFVTKFGGEAEKRRLNGVGLDAMNNLAVCLSEVLVEHLLT